MPVVPIQARKYILKIAIVIFGLLLTLSAQAQNELLPQVKLALKSLDDINNNHWSFKHSRYTNHELAVSYFDPRKAIDQQWQLVLLNNKVPTVEQLEDFNNIWNVANTSEAESFTAMIAQDSLSFSYKQGGYAVFNFRPLVEDMLDHQAFLTGEIWLNLSTGDIKELSIKNNQPLMPAVSIELDIFNMVFEFKRVLNRLVYQRITLKLSGTVGYVQDLSEQNIEEFSDHLHIGDKN